MSAAITEYLAGRASAPITVMELLLETEDVAAARHAILGAGDPRATELLRLLEQHRAACESITTLLASGIDDPSAPTSVDQAISRVRALFDVAVVVSEESSVALYSLGSKEILARATEEIVAALREWRSLGASRRVVEIGCGIGRIASAIAGEVASYVGVDVSPRMIEIASRRCAGIRNASFSISDGRDLSVARDGALHLVLSVDTWPYIHWSGPELVRRMLAESARVLAPGGDLVILEYSYRRNVEADISELRALAPGLGFELVSLGERPFRIWNGAAYRLRRVRSA